ALAGAPISGAWFHNQFIELVNNAYPVIATASTAVATAAPVAAPSATRGLTAAVGDSRVRLSWSPVAGATSYTVQRRAGGAGAFTTVGANVAAASYVDQSVSNGADYDYVVTANSAAGASAPSAVVRAKPNR
ncbi:fibronectin type III domain-containing protein, partial [Xanthomonas cannabis]